MADYSKVYRPTKWIDDSQPSITAGNLNNMEDFLEELDDRTKDLQAEKLGKDSSFAKKAEEFSEVAKTAAESSAAEAIKAAGFADDAEESAEAAEQALSGLDSRVTALEQTVGDVNAAFNTLFD